MTTDDAVVSVADPSFLGFGSHVPTERCGRGSPSAALHCDTGRRLLTGQVLSMDTKACEGGRVQAPEGTGIAERTRRESACRGVQEEGICVVDCGRLPPILIEISIVYLYGYAASYTYKGGPCLPPAISLDTAVYPINTLHPPPSTVYFETRAQAGGCVRCAFDSSTRRPGDAAESKDSGARVQRRRRRVR